MVLYQYDDTGFDAKGGRVEVHSGGKNQNDFSTG